MGSKSRIKKYIIPIIESYIDENTEWYIEPFVGGANVIDKIDFDKKIGCDKHKELIAFLNAVNNNVEIPEKISKEHYLEVKQSFKNKDNKYDDYYYGLIGFLGAFRGLFFDSPACEDYNSEGRIRNNYIESRKNILKQRDNLKNIKFKCIDFLDIPTNLKNCVIYCDPPYRNTSQKGYADINIFPYDEFYDWCRKLSKNNVVLVSEYNMPDDFECIWEKEVSTNLAVNHRKKDIERLFKI